MLSLVHSAPVVSVEFDPDPGASALTLHNGTGLWSDELAGLLVLSEAGSLYLVKLDGSAARLSRPAGGVHSWQGLGYHVALDRPTLSTLYGDWIPVEIPTTQPLADAVAAGQPSMAVLADRVLRYGGGTVRASVPGELVTMAEKVLRGGSAGAGVIAPAMRRPCSRWWCLSTDGWADLYDSTTHEVLATTKLDAGWRCAGYSRKHDLFATIAADLTLRVYANDPEPASVTAPVFSSAPARGSVRTLSVRVLGAEGEPCPGHVLQFAVSAGSVDPLTAETDETGTAAVTYRAPLVAQSDVLATATLDEG